MEKLRSTLVEAGFEPTTQVSPDESGYDFYLDIQPNPAGRPQGYELSINSRRIHVVGWGEPGLFYGICTLAQWISLHQMRSESSPGIALQAVEIRDWPDFVDRGVLLDISRDKVPTMATLFTLVDRLASWKVNQLQLYMEHTFAYRGHEKVWRNASPLTADEVRKLDAYCNSRFIELVPNQNSFGHFHRWLVHPEYKSLAECPEGVDHPFSTQREPFSLCPTDPEALSLLEDLYDQLLPQFSSKMFNVGLDETIDLGLGRSASACSEQGKGRVYLNFLRSVYRLVLERGRQMQFWADIVLQHPKLTSAIPRDAIALLWGYEADHSFLKDAASLAKAGLAHYVCPGTSSWNSFAGRASNALANLSNAAIAGSKSGARGYLITDWGDNGHLQPLTISYLGYLAGACMSWNVGHIASKLDQDISVLLDAHAFRGATGLGEVAQALGDLHLATGATPKNGSALFYWTLFPDSDLDSPRFRGLDKTSIESAGLQLDEISRRLSEATEGQGGSGLEKPELEWVAAMLEFSISLGRARLETGRSLPLAAIPEQRRHDLVQKLEPLIEVRRNLWLLRNRAGGLEDAFARLERLRKLLKNS
jgi:hypothetical protein